MRSIDTPTKPRKPKRSRFSTAPIVLGMALALGYGLTSRFVPMYWASMLPGGLSQARFFRGWPGLLWASAVACHRDFGAVAVVLGGIWFLGFFLSTFVRPLRPIVWLMAIAVIALDGGIIYVAARVAIEATAQSAGGVLPEEISP